MFSIPLRKILQTMRGGSLELKGTVAREWFGDRNERNEVGEQGRWRAGGLGGKVLSRQSPDF